MEVKKAIEALAALAQEHRLAVFRLLVREGPSGLPAGEIADRVAVPSSTLSRHLAHLEHAQLLRSWRVKRQIYYAVDIGGTGRLLAFLMEDCCQGRPEICGYGSAENCCEEGDLSHTPVADNQGETREMADKIITSCFSAPGTRLEASWPRASSIDWDKGDSCVQRRQPSGWTGQSTRT